MFDKMFDKYKLLFEIANCVKFENFKLASGKESPYKIDIDPLTDYESKLEFLADQMSGFSTHSGFKPDYFVGVPSGTTTLAIEMTRQINYISPEEKKIVWREKDSNYIGKIEKGDKVVVVDDVVTTGKSLEDEVQKIKFEGANVIGAIVIVDRFERNKEFDFPYNYAIGIDELFNVLERQNRIPEDYKEKVDNYRKLNVRQVA